MAILECQSLLVFGPSSLVGYVQEAPKIIAKIGASCVFLAPQLVLGAYKAVVMLGGSGAPACRHVHMRSHFFKWPAAMWLSANTRPPKFPLCEYCFAWVDERLVLPFRGSYGCIKQAK